MNGLIIAELNIPGSRCSSPISSSMAFSALYPDSTLIDRYVKRKAVRIYFPTQDQGTFSQAGLAILLSNEHNNFCGRVAKSKRKLSAHQLVFCGMHSLPAVMVGSFTTFHGRMNIMSTMNYVKCFLRDRNVASITPTSPFGVKRVCKKIDFSTANVIVEYGPGAGVFTEYLLKKMRPTAHLVLIERNPDMFKCLQESFRDQRVHLFNDSAENVGNLVNGQLPHKPDYVISGIPFSYIDQQARQDIIQQTHEVLADKGKFLAYQTFYQKDDHLFVHLEHYFKQVKSEFELLNIPPMRIYEAMK